MVYMPYFFNYAENMNDKMQNMKVRILQYSKHMRVFQF